MVYVRYARTGRLGSYLLALVTFAVGLMAKPMLVTLPATLILLDYWPLGRLRLEKENNAWMETTIAMFKEKIPFAFFFTVSNII